VRAGVVLLVLSLAARADADHVGKWVELDRGQQRQYLQLVKRLGQGNFSETYLAHNREDGHDYAVKLLAEAQRKPGASDEASYRREVALSQRVRHPVLIMQHGIGAVWRTSTGRKAVVMDIAHGRAVGDPNQDAANGAMRSTVAVGLAMQVLRGLRAMHQAGVRHNDVHPGNVMMNGEDLSSVRLLDLGQATEIADQTLGGHSTFSAPELRGGGAHTQGQVSSDLYSVGMTLAYLLTGRLPKDGYMPLLPEVSAWVGGRQVTLRQVLLRATHADPKQRFQSAQELLDALRPFST
jgi:eukaryotic-like serine/threonine-protein kinase